MFHYGSKERNLQYQITSTIDHYMVDGERGRENGRRERERAKVSIGENYEIILARIIWPHPHKLEYYNNNMNIDNNTNMNMKMNNSIQIIYSVVSVGFVQFLVSGMPRISEQIVCQAINHKTPRAK